MGKRKKKKKNLFGIGGCQWFSCGIVLYMQSFSGKSQPELMFSNEYQPVLVFSGKFSIGIGVSNLFDCIFSL
jgi:hypothetical protein